MSDLGDLFGGIGEFIGGLREASDEDGGGAVGGFLAAMSGGDRGGSNAEGYDATIVVDRYLTGAPRVLNINDL